MNPKSKNISTWEVSWFLILFSLEAFFVTPLSASASALDMSYLFMNASGCKAGYLNCYGDL